MRPPRYTRKPPAVHRRLSLLSFRRADGYATRSKGIDKGRWEKELRVDAAPCWNRNGTAVVAPGIAKDGTRQMFLISLQ